MPLETSPDILFITRRQGSNGGAGFAAPCQHFENHGASLLQPPNRTGLGGIWAAFPQHSRGSRLVAHKGPFLSLFVPYLFIAPLPGRRGCFPDDVTHSIIPLPAHLPRSRLLRRPLDRSRSRRDISVLPGLPSRHHGMKGRLHRRFPGRDAFPAPLCSRLSRSTLVFPNKVREPQAAEARRGWEAASSCSHCQPRIKITPSLHKGRKNPGVWCQNPGLAALPAREQGAFSWGFSPGKLSR